MRAVLGKLALLLFGTLFALGAGEVAVRLFTETPRPLDYRDPIVGKTYLPDYEANVYVPECRCRVDVRFNREGFRGPDLPYEAAPGVRRVALVGDSMIAAIATAEEHTMAAVLEDRLEQATGDPWEVMNFGVSGSSTGQETVLYRERIRQYAPDYVVVAFYMGNDLADNDKKLSSSNRIYFDFDDDGKLVQLPFSAGAAKRSVWFNRNSRLYVWQKTALRRILGQSSFEDTPNFVYTTRERPRAEHAWKLTGALLEHFKSEVEADGAKLTLVILPEGAQVYDDAWQEILDRGGDETQYLQRDAPNRRLAAVSKAAGVPSLDLLDAFREFAPGASSEIESEVAFYNGRNHFNRAGNRIAAEELAEFLTANIID